MQSLIAELGQCICNIGTKHHRWSSGRSDTHKQLLFSVSLSYITTNINCLVCCNQILEDEMFRLLLKFKLLLFWEVLVQWCPLLYDFKTKSFLECWSFSHNFCTYNIVQVKYEYVCLKFKIIILIILKYLFLSLLYIKSIEIHGMCCLNWYSTGRK